MLQHSNATDRWWVVQRCDSLRRMAHQAIPVLPGLQDYTYEPRLISFLGATRSETGWYMKRYVITLASKKGAMADAAVQAAERAAGVALPLPRGAGASHGVAVLTMHMGLQGFWVLVDWWAHGDVLMHRHLCAPAEQPEALHDAAPEGFGPCVWELAVQAHERQAWLRHVLVNPGGHDVDAYLADGLTAMV